ncbi:hypothetical protein FT663_01321 [Candidozyma haemuli var. vulneris]|uniref:Myosin-binding domain-containing protein n=1 Tax=Candidozyma haemuli TaxID=45357 RepID=A0A2V1AZ34_9ASCO|nr:hypothetical protein CXQ85_002475 [[Candida] haemuloni]KAF3993910.1 hypothetical protein FT662_00358 [[Candida] haemuloni var. vulneris]KAF3994521.1 hypothetical protein FT663_01321 [[Candida] haemuloni var. vulneris]PVH22756.1 hypothetical protein CXQ85_002475 [[Candida] haemuloni]
MNFDKFGFGKFNLLSNYSPAEADWGIEEPIVPPRPRFNSTSTSEYSHSRRLREYSVRTPSFATSSYCASAAAHKALPSTTESFHKFIKKYLSLEHKGTAIVERFKYNLVVSNLLDASMVLSKNEQALNNLVQIRNEVDSTLHVKLAKEFSFDGTTLEVINKQYRLSFPSEYSNPLLLLNIISLIIFLLKQNFHIRSHVPYAGRITMFKILLIMATRIVKCKRAKTTLTASRSLRSLDDFMISNCRVNKALITSMISLKEFEMFAFMNKTSNTDSATKYSDELKNHLNMLLTCLSLNIRHSVSTLLPMCNGSLLEQYCEINNVQMTHVFEEIVDHPEEQHTLESLKEKLNAFNNLRRFFICQLLTIHDSPQRNFFMLKLYDAFHIDDAEVFQLNITDRLTKLEHIFENHTKTLDQLLALNEKFKLLKKSAPSTDYANDDVLSRAKAPVERRDDELFLMDSELNLRNLINKLSSVTTSLSYFKKYSQSISDVNDSEEYEEKMSIFSSFQSELRGCLDLYNICKSDYEGDYSRKFRPPSQTSSASTSQRNSLNSNEQFNPKSFQTGSSGSMKKRYSLPSNGEGPRSEYKSGSTKNGSSDKRYKRLSTGLQLGLLTVFEEPTKKDDIASEPSNKDEVKSNDLVSPRGSYANTSPPSNYDNFNQAALDALTRRKTNRHSVGRFSVNSLNSNISGITDLIASTQGTGDEDEGEISKASLLSGPMPPGISKEELKKKLEESFTRIYSLESENNELKKSSLDAPGERSDTDDFLESDSMSKRTVDPSFMANLEKTLNQNATAS